MLKQIYLDLYSFFCLELASRFLVMAGLLRFGRLGLFFRFLLLDVFRLLLRFFLGGFLTILFALLSTFLLFFRILLFVQFVDRLASPRIGLPSIILFILP